VKGNGVDEISTDAQRHPDVVYHYTSMPVLLKIIEEKQLWATNARFLNDISEYQFFLSAAQGRLPAVIPDLEFIDLASWAKQESRPPGGVPDFLSVPFVTSFSLHDDSLTNWRSYCSVGNGVSIGFRTGSLYEAYVDRLALPGVIVPEPDFGGVYYLDPNNTDFVDSTIRNAYEAAKDDLLRFPLDNLPAALARRLASAASFVKDHSFENEGEYRLTVGGIGWRRDLLRFKTTRSTLVPYLRMNIPALPSAPRKIGESDDAWNAIASITIGPTPNMSLSFDSLSVFCSTHGIEPTISGSRVPYREW
jgi:hypothetical protein